MRIRLILSLIIITILPSLAFSLDIKNADLAGSWYPSNPTELSKKIKSYLANAKPADCNGDLIAIISPHAGLQYSGPVAAYGFKLAQGRQINTVIIVGFSHKQDYDGIAIFNGDGIKTPLGTLSADKELIQKLINSNKKIIPKPDVFANENSVEMILPFIQVALDNPKVVLLAIGSQSLENSQLLGLALAQILKTQKNFLLIASTDMSHYLPLDEAIATDKESAQLIKQFEPEKLFLSCYSQNRMCGFGAASAVMVAAKKLGADKVVILKQGTSADSSWEHQRVVGYLSAALIKENKGTLTENKKMDELLNEQQKKKLLKLARDTISLYLSTGKTLEPKEDDPVLKQVMGAFVTLHKDGELRGCIGNIVGQKPLYLTVRDMAIASASEDPRFNSVTKEELPKIHIEISALSPLEKITDPGKIILGKHGVLVKDLFRSGVYLPQVATETGWTKEQFMDSLCASKAGMSPDAWKTGKCDIYIFSAEVFAE